MAGNQPDEEPELPQNPRPDIRLRRDAEPVKYYRLRRDEFNVGGPSVRIFSTTLNPWITQLKQGQLDFEYVPEINALIPSLRPPPHYPPGVLPPYLNSILPNDGPFELANVPLPVGYPVPPFQLEDILAQQERPMVQDQQPPVQQQEPMVQDQQPPVKQEHILILEEPPQEEQLLLLPEQLPVQDEIPMVQDEIPMVQDEIPPVQEEQPMIQDEQPPVQQEQPMVQDQQPPVQQEGRSNRSGSKRKSGEGSSSGSKKKHS